MIENIFIVFWPVDPETQMLKNFYYPGFAFEANSLISC